MKKSREVLDSERIAEVQTTKNAERIDLLLERLASTKHGRECGDASFKLGEQRRSRRASTGEVEVQGAQDNAVMELRIHCRHGQVRRGSTAMWRYLDGEIREMEQRLTGSSWAWSERTGVAARGEFWRRAMRETATIQRLEGIPACATRGEEHVEHRGAIRGLGSA
jgi:hypothetical protein